MRKLILVLAFGLLVTACGSRHLMEDEVLYTGLRQHFGGNGPPWSEDPYIRPQITDFEKNTNFFADSETSEEVTRCLISALVFENKGLGIEVLDSLDLGGIDLSDEAALQYTAWQLYCMNEFEQLDFDAQTAEFMIQFELWYELWHEASE